MKTRFRARTSFAVNSMRRQLSPVLAAGLIGLSAFGLVHAAKTDLTDQPLATQGGSEGKAKSDVHPGRFRQHGLAIHS